MNTTAIRQAIKLYKHPLEMSGLAAVHAALPSGTTDLLRLCASEKQLEAFSTERNLDSDMLYNVLTHFIENVLFKEGCSPYKILGIDETGIDNIDGEPSSEKLRLHFQLLMNIYHPDRNRSSSSAFYTSKISKAYDVLKRDQANTGITLPTPPEEQFYNEPPKSYYQATHKAQKQINQTRNTFFALASVAFLTLITTLIYLNQPDSSRLIVRNQAPATDTFALASSLTSQQTLSTIDNTTYQNTGTVNRKISGKVMQTLLHKLENAYEQGNIKQITPILANVPELQQKTDAELSAKLKTLFKITQDRKMVLYDFSWVNIGGQIKGQGQFLSRYLLAGEDEWQTRTGPATVSAEIDNDDMIHITTLNMNDQEIQQ